jgi:protein-tyrosine phosphatase
MQSQLFWVPCPWPGRLAIIPRPRGGDWLEDEVRLLRRAGVDCVVSLLTREEAAEIGLAAEEEVCGKHGIRFYSFPIVDREVPSSREATSKLVTQLAGHLAEGKNLTIHCRQGIGRAPLIAIGLLTSAGLDPEVAIQRVSTARGHAVPETVEQRRWIIEIAKSFAASSAGSGSTPPA